MATLDVSDAFDPSFLSLINVIRRVETVSTHGRSTVTPTTFSNIQAVVMPASPSDLRRIPEADINERTLSIYTRFDIMGPPHTPTDKADLIQFDGLTFIVINTSDFAHYGSGFMGCVATLFN